MLRMLNSKPKLPWCCFGDFNELLQVEDKKGVHRELIIPCRPLGMFFIIVVLWIWVTWVQILLGMGVIEVN